MERNELLKSPEYWTTKIQNELYNQINDYLLNKGLTKSQLAKQLGVSKGYVSQVLNGDFNHRISKMVDLSLAIGMVPKIEWIDLGTVLDEDNNQTTPLQIHYWTNQPDYNLTPTPSLKLQKTETGTVSIEQQNDFFDDTNKAV